MAIVEAPFDNERELQEWIAGNVQAFLPRSLYLPGCQVTTISGKHGVPDGFAFNFTDRAWYVIECELLSHGVWPHIAEQVVRFVVAMQNPQSRRKIRDRLFDHILETNRLEQVVGELDTTRERVLQQLELFIEGVEPQLAIFIDDTNQDLHDMAHALNAKTNIFRVQKFIVNGQAEYHSPDQHTAVIVTEPPEHGGSKETEYDIVAILGGGNLETSVGRFKCYRLNDGSIVHLKKSKFHPRGQYYWYGVGSAALNYIEQYSVTHIAFVMGDEGFVKVPLDTVKAFLQHTAVSKNEDGSIRHYHCLISPGPEPELYWSNEQPRYPLAECFQAFD